MRGVIPAAWRLGTTIAAPALRAMLRRRVAHGKEEADRLGEREGIERSERPPGRLLWVHAASVGESVSMLPVLVCLARRAPDVVVLLTTGTVTSARVLERRLPELGLDRVLHRFVPLDVPAWAARFLDHWRPCAAAFVESELWPNLLEACQARGIRMMLVNGRMSARSFRQWGRFPEFAREIVGAFDRVHAQSSESNERLLRLGARGLEAAGDLKLAAPRLPVDAAEASRLERLIGGRPVWLAASTHPGEEVLAGEAHRLLCRAHPRLLTIVAPRHPDRGAEVAAALGGAPRRSAGDGPPEGGVWVADTMGEMGLLYQLSPIVFMGKSLVDGGGQNPLEAARFGCAIAAGPHTANFDAAVGRLLDAGGLARVSDGPALAGWIDRMLRDRLAREQAGQAARAVADGEGALPERVAAALLGLMPS